MKLVMIFSSYFLLLNGTCLGQPAHSVEQQIQDILKKYETNVGVIMNVKKITRLNFLKKNRISHGKIFLSKGLMALQMVDSMGTRIIFDKAKNVIWYITDFESNSQKVVKVDLSGNKGLESFLVFLFYRERFSDVFRFASSRSKGRAHIMDFKPITNSDIKGMSIKVENQLILKAWVKWKSLNNEEEYEFSDIRFNQSIPLKQFRWNDKS